MRRAGSTMSPVHVGCQTERVKRPRVRRRAPGSGQGEVALRSYEAAQAGEELRAAILRALESGVSTRDQSRLNPKATRCSKSEVSRQWEAAGRKRVEEIRSRPLASEGYVALMLDGVVLSQSCTAIVALGIDRGGRKHMLDFEIGASENTEVCKALCTRLCTRGFKPAATRLLVVLDGSDALRNAAEFSWPGCLIQRCLVHLQRNLRGRLARRWHGELAGHFKRLRQAGTFEAASEAFDELLAFAARHTHEGGATLRKVRDDALRVARLNAGDQFNRSLLSTNSIENAIRNMRSVLSRPKRWRPETDMPDRWIAAAMLKAERGFHRISGYAQLDQLIARLNNEESSG